jgi:hypothetical protein
MLSSEDTSKRQLFVDTETPGTEIMIIDSEGKVLDVGVQRMARELPPALYKIRYRVGNQVADQIFELPPGIGQFELKVPQLPILSAAPLSTVTEAQSPPGKFLEEVMRRPRMGASKPASIFIFIMSEEDSSSQSPVLLEPGAGLSVHTFTGEKVADLATAETLNGCSACTIPVDPGNYLLRTQMALGKPIEQTLVAVKGWQTQLYVRMAPIQFEGRTDAAPGSPPTSSGLAPVIWQTDLGRSGVLMIEEPAQQAPTESDIRWTAAARQALAAGRSNAAPDREMMTALLNGKFRNPMLGIYAGHLLAMQEKPDKDLLREIVDNVLKLVDNHPDVTSLMIPLADPRAREIVYNEPPMLRSSWSLILGASTFEYDLRAPQSYAARIAGSLWGSGPWLAWRMPVEVESGTSSGDPLKTLYAEALSGKLSLAIRTIMASEEMKSKLTPTEALLVRYVDLASRHLAMAQELTSEDDKRGSLSVLYPLIRPFFDSDLQKDTKALIADAFTPNRLTKFTGLPYSSVQGAASSLALKLGLSQGTSFVSQVFNSLKRKRGQS